MLLVGIVVELKAFDPNSLVPTTFDELIVKAVASLFCADKPLIDIPSKKLTTTSQTSHVFTHNLNTFDVIVQLYDTSSKETVYAAVDRTSVNVVTATTAASASLTALIQKIG